MGTIHLASSETSVQGETYNPVKKRRHRTFPRIVLQTLSAIACGDLGSHETDITGVPPVMSGGAMGALFAADGWKHDSHDSPKTGIRRQNPFVFDRGVKMKSTTKSIHRFPFGPTTIQYKVNIITLLRTVVGPNGNRCMDLVVDFILTPRSKTNGFWRLMPVLGHVMTVMTVMTVGCFHSHPQRHHTSSLPLHVSSRLMSTPLFAAAAPTVLLLHVSSPVTFTPLVPGPSRIMSSRSRSVLSPPARCLSVAISAAAAFAGPICAAVCSNRISAASSGA